MATPMRTPPKRATQSAQGGKRASIGGQAPRQPPASASAALRALTMPTAPRSHHSASAPAAAAQPARAASATPKNRSSKKKWCIADYVQEQQAEQLAPVMQTTRLQQRSLKVETLMPLIDLAYSKHTEVQRDAAAVLATLSMNEDNLDVLSQAGALGALLALVGVSNRGPHGRGPKTDSQARFGQERRRHCPRPPRSFTHHRPSCIMP